jgi:hypothetical protein
MPARKEISMLPQNAPPGRAGAPPNTEPAFGYAEHLLIWSWRRVAANREMCPLIGREFAESCGADAGEVFATFCALLRALAFARRRALAVGHPGSLAVTPDERQLLNLVAAAQEGRDALFEAHLRWLAKPEAREVLAMAARGMAAALSANGLALALTPIDAPSRCDGPPALVPAH